MKHEHGKVVIEIYADGDHLTGKIEGNGYDIVCAISGLMENDKQFEAIILKVLEVRAKSEIVNLLEHSRVEKELQKGKEVKN